MNIRGKGWSVLLGVLLTMLSACDDPSGPIAPPDSNLVPMPSFAYASSAAATEITPDANTVVLDHFNDGTVGVPHGTLNYAASDIGLGKAGVFGLGNYVEYVLNEPLLVVKGTVEMWVRPSTLADPGPLLRDYTGLLAFNWFHWTDYASWGHMMYFDLWPKAENAPWTMLYDHVVVQGPTPVPVGDWTHLALSWGPAGTKLYTNGVPVAEVSGHPSGFLPTTYAYLNYWGEDKPNHNGDILAFRGLFDELHISKVQRTDAEILAHATLAPTNQPPVADPNGSYMADEGSPVSFDGAGSSDPDGDALTYDWEWGDGSSLLDAGASPSHTYAGNGDYAVCLTVTDPGGLSDTACTTAKITNVPPTCEPITGLPIAPVQVGTLVSASAVFSDHGTLDTHTAEWDWNDGSTSSGTVTESDGSGTVGTDSHTYANAGIHALGLTVTDSDGDICQQTFEYVVVYDPEGGFVTGGGWIDSPEGACELDLSLTGKANFGFVAKYKNGASTPDGSTEFQFKAGDLNFRSSSYDWLVVNQNDSNAQFKGAGTINGMGDFRFMLWAGDHDSGDTFRIKIWEQVGGVEDVVYDNGFEEAISGGSIVVHTGKK